MPAIRIDHIGIAVESIEDSLGFYRALGLEVDHIEDVPQEGVRVAMIQVGESKVELLEATSDDSPVRKFLDRHGPGIHHLCYATDDIRADQERLHANGVETLRREPTRGAGGCWVQFIHPKEAGGVLVELSESDRSH